MAHTVAAVWSLARVRRQQQHLASQGKRGGQCDAALTATGSGSRWRGCGWWFVGPVHRGRWWWYRWPRLRLTAQHTRVAGRRAGERACGSMVTGTGKAPMTAFGIAGQAGGGNATPHLPRQGRVVARRGCGWWFVGPVCRGRWWWYRWPRLRLTAWHTRVAGRRAGKRACGSVVTGTGKAPMTAFGIAGQAGGAM